MARVFPGVDPYLEAQHYWPDFHIRFTNYWCEAIAEALPDSYEAALDERIHLVERADQVLLRTAKPDMAVVQRGSPPAAAPPGGVAVLARPFILPVLILEEEREVSIRIIHRRDRRLVAALELLSPSNKVNPGRGEYLAKRNALLHDRVHLIEVDLLVEGERVPMAGPLPPGDGFAIVARGDRRPESEVYAWSIREPLPTIAIPLLAPDPDIVLDLNAVYGTAFDRGRFSRRVDYGAGLALGLGPEDLAWAEGVARGGPSAEETVS